MISGLGDANGGDGFQHLHRVVLSKFFENRRADAGIRKDPEEGGVSATNSIFVINCCNGANHSFEQLCGKHSFAAGFQNALTHIAEMSLHLPDRSTCDQGADEDRGNAPNENCSFRLPLIEQHFSVDVFIIRLRNRYNFFETLFQLLVPFEAVLIV